MKSPVKYIGGKFYLAPKIVELFPTHSRYVEPYFGSGAVLFAKDPAGCSEYANDIYRDLMVFWQHLADPQKYDQFVRVITGTPFSEELWKSTFQVPTNELDQAVKLFIRIRQSRQGLENDFVTPTSRLRSGMNEHISAWLGSIDGLPEIHKRLRQVEIWNRDAIECIRKLDSQATLFYLDPTYLPETRVSPKAYKNREMTVAEHETLLDTLETIKGKFVLSGYPSKLYETYRARNNWFTHDFEIDNKASGRRVKEKKIERIWMNYDPDARF